MSDPFHHPRRMTALVMAGSLAFCAMAQLDEVDSLTAILRTHRPTGSLADTLQAGRYNQLARLYTGEGALDSALWSSARAISILDGIRVEKGDAALLDRHLLNAHKLQGIAHFYGSDYARALTSMQRFQRVAERMGSTGDIGASYNYMSYCFRGMGDVEQARVHALKAIAVLRGLPEEGEDMANAYTGLASIYSDQGPMDSVLHYNRLALVIYGRTGNVLNATNTWLNLAETWMKAGRSDSSLYCLERARPGIEETQEVTSMIKFHGQVGRALLSQGRLAEADRELARADTLATELDNPEDLGHVHDLQALTAAARGAFPDAFDHLEKARDAMLRDMDIKKARELTEARLNFEHAEEKALAEDRLREQRQFKRYALAGGGLVFLIALLLLVLYRTTRRSRSAVQREKDISDGLLLNILPAEVAEELKRKGHTEARQVDRATILFTDFKGFTTLSERLSAADLVGELDHCFKAFDAIVEKHGIEKIKTIGDAYMAAGGLTTPVTSMPVDAVRAALEMQAFLRGRALEREGQGRSAFEMRVGIHTGPVVAGIVGSKKFQYDIWGDTVNTASHLEGSGEVGQVNISGSTYALVKDEPGLTFTPRGKVQAKGKGRMDMYFVRRSDAVA